MMDDPAPEPESVAPDVGSRALFSKPQRLRPQLLAAPAPPRRGVLPPVAQCCPDRATRRRRHHLCDLEIPPLAERDAFASGDGAEPHRWNDEGAPMDAPIVLHHVTWIARLIGLTCTSRRYHKLDCSSQR